MPCRRSRRHDERRAFILPFVRHPLAPSLSTCTVEGRRAARVAWTLASLHYCNPSKGSPTLQLGGKYLARRASSPNAVAARSIAFFVCGMLPRWSSTHGISDKTHLVLSRLGDGCSGSWGARKAVAGCSSRCAQFARQCTGIRSGKQRPLRFSKNPAMHLTGEDPPSSACGALGRCKKDWSSINKDPNPKSRGAPCPP